MKVPVNSVLTRLEGLPEGSRFGGRVTKRGKREEKDSAEINEYLHKLQELVPFTPKNKKLSKLEVISYVIDYIQDLRETLGLPPSPCQNGQDKLDEQFTWMLMDSSVCDEAPIEVRAPSTIPTNSATVTSGNLSSPVAPSSTRQPLGVISNPTGNGNVLSQNDLVSPNSLKFPGGPRIPQTSCSSQF